MFLISICSWLCFLLTFASASKYNGGLLTTTTSLKYDGRPVMGFLSVPKGKSHRSTLVWGESDKVGRWGEGSTLVARKTDLVVTEDSAYCIVTADETPFQNAQIARVPAFKSTENGYNSESLAKEYDEIDRYINTIDEYNTRGDSERDIRVVKDNGGDPDIEIVIPPKIVNARGGGLGIRVACTTDLGELTGEEVDVECGPYAANAIGEWEAWDDGTGYRSDFTDEMIDSDSGCDL